MRTFDETKTYEIQNPDLDNGYLRPDLLVTAHHEAIPRKVLKTEEQIAEELRAQGKEVNLRTNDETHEQHYYVVTEIYYRDGKRYGNDEDLIRDEVQEAQEAWDETEEIQVYVPFTEEQKKDYLRGKRERLLLAFDIWEKAVLRGRESEDEKVMQWYYDLLDLKENAFKEENIPERIKYYL